MARLLLLRHSKAGTPEGVLDRDRPLAPRGRRDAPRVGTWLAGCGRVPDEIWSSDAARTLETAELVRVGLAGSGAEAVPVQAFPDLYDTSAHQVLRLVAAADEATDVLLVVGHEPTMSQVAAALTGQAVDFRTSTVATVDLPEGWPSAAARTGTLVDVHNPR